MHIKKPKKRRYSKPKRDMGTPELLEKRRLLTLSGQANCPHTESTLGILLLNGEITKEMYDAGNTFRSLHYSYNLTFGIPQRPILTSTAKSFITMLPKHILSTSQKDTSIERKLCKVWKNVHTFIHQLGKEPYRAAMHVSIYSLPHETLSPHTLYHARYALFRLDNWIRLGKCARIKEKAKGKL